MAFTAVQFWQFAEEAMRRALLSKSEIEKQALMDLAQTWTQAAFRSESAMVVNNGPTEHRPRPIGKISGQFYTDSPLI